MVRGGILWSCLSRETPLYPAAGVQNNNNTNTRIRACQKSGLKEMLMIMYFVKNISPVGLSNKKNTHTVHSCGCGASEGEKGGICPRYILVASAGLVNLPQSRGSPVLASCPPKKFTPSSLGSGCLVATLPLSHSFLITRFEIALHFVTTPWCFIRFPCFISMKKAASEMLSCDYSACLHTLGTEGRPFLMAPEGSS